MIENKLKVSVKLRWWITMIILVTKSNYVCSLSTTLQAPSHSYVVEALSSLSDSVHALNYIQSHDIYDNAVELSSDRTWFESEKALEYLTQLRNSSANSTHHRCLNNFIEFFAALIHLDMWAIQMTDSYGKIGSGILQGNTRWPGSFSQCQNITQQTYIFETVGEPFQGQYCIMNFILEPGAKKTTPNGTWTPPLQMGVCVPDSCSVEELNIVFNNLLGHLSPLTKYLQFSGITCIPKSQDMWSDTKAVVSFSVLMVFVALMVLGTAYDVYKSIFSFPPAPSDKKGYNRMNDSNSIIVNNSDKEIGTCHEEEIKPDSIGDGELPPPFVETKQPSIGLPEQLLLSFSVYTNGSKIFSLKENKDVLSPLNGIRFFSMTWVILGHTYLLGSPQTDNLLVVLDVMKTVAFQLVAQGPYSVDSFFVLSGLLVTYLYLKEHKRSNGNISWIKFYLHRYWRLTPTYLLVMFLICDGFSKYWSTGPFWLQNGLNADKCEKSWWWNILYINNFQPTKYMCMAHTWYLANDMQFYVISPIILIFLTRRFPVAALGGVFGGVFILSQWITTGLISKHYEFSANMDLSKMPPGTDAYDRMFDILYDKPYNRISPYIIGMACGWLLFKTNCKIKLSKPIVVLGWTLAAICNLYLVFGMYHSNPGLTFSAFHNSVSRTAWALGMAWLIFACCTGYGGFINSFLSWPAWSPLSRLTYCAYLWHINVITTVIYSGKELPPFSHTTMIYNYLANVIMSYLGALFLSLAFESPIMAIERYLLQKYKS